MVVQVAGDSRRINCRKSRSANDNLFGDEHAIYKKAKMLIEDSIWHVNPFPISHHIEGLRADVWKKAMMETGLSAQRSADANKQVGHIYFVSHFVFYAMAPFLITKYENSYLP